MRKACFNNKNKNCFLKGNDFFVQGIKVIKNKSLTLQ